MGVGGIVLRLLQIQRGTICTPSRGRLTHSYREQSEKVVSYSMDSAVPEDDKVIVSLTRSH